MDSTSPSPNSAPSTISPTSSNTLPVSPVLQPDQATASPPAPPLSQSEQATASPPAPPVSQPEQATASPPTPATPITSLPPVSLPTLPGTNAPPPATSPPPPPPSDASPPAPVIPASPPPTPPPSTPVSTPPPLPPVTAPPPAATSPPPPILSPPPPSTDSPPPPPPDQTASPPSPTQPNLSPPPPAAVSPSPPPPKNTPSPPNSASPPPPHAKPPKHSPPGQQQAPPPSPPSSTTPSSSTSPPPPLSTPANSSTTAAPPGLQLPSVPTEKPTARATDTSTTGRENGTPGGSGGKSNNGAVIGIGVVLGFVTLSLFVLAVWFKRRQKRRYGRPNVYVLPSPSSSSQKSDSQFLRSHQSAHPLAGGSPSISESMYSPDNNGVGNSRSCFTYEELSDATHGFSGSKLLGEGGFGCVYKGMLEDGREVAVKQLKIGGGQGEREFQAEVEIISRVHHRHLVSLVGYCISERQRLLVYQFVSNDTLHYHLHGEGRPVMDWPTRIKVAAGAARGLAYLHEDCHPRIIHRDIKSSNILLDENFDALVADFGLAKLAGDTTNTHISTRVMGTFGYMAPEYALSGKLTEKSDVYSFGVMLLELITGRKPVDASQPLGDESLVEWARPLLNKALENEDFDGLVDPRLGKDYVQVEMFRLMEAAAACIRHLAPKRPRMSQVVRALDSIVEFTTDLSNGMKPGQSEIYDSREQSAQIRLFQRMAFGSQDYNSSEYYNNTQSTWKS